MSASFDTDPLESTLEVPSEIVHHVRDTAFKLDGGPITYGQVMRTMRALIVLGWNDWPEHV